MTNMSVHRLRSCAHVSMLVIQKPLSDRLQAGMTSMTKHGLSSVVDLNSGVSDCACTEAIY